MLHSLSFSGGTPSGCARVCVSVKKAVGTRFHHFHNLLSVPHSCHVYGLTAGGVGSRGQACIAQHSNQSCCPFKAVSSQLHLHQHQQGPTLVHQQRLQGLISLNFQKGCEFTATAEAVWGLLHSVLSHQQMQHMVKWLCTVPPCSCPGNHWN